MRVYRMECENGHGPFQWSYPVADGISSHGQRHGVDYWGLPTPWEEGLEFDCARHCGATSLDQLSRWFPPEMRKEMTEAGLDLVLYEVPDELVQLGEAQCVFRKADAVSRNVIGSM